MMHLIDTPPSPTFFDPLSPESLGKLELNPAQQADLRAIYPHLAAAQETLVELHVDAALHLLLEKSLRVFHQQAVMVQQQEDGLLAPNLHENVAQLNVFLKTIGLMPESVTLTVGNLQGAIKRNAGFFDACLDAQELEDCLQDVAEAILPLCHSAAGWKSSDIAKGRIALALEHRQAITQGANEYEIKIDNFLTTHDPENNTRITDEDREEVQHYKRELWSWRDGGRSDLPPSPQIAGFPIPDFPAILNPHPLVQNVESISQTLSNYGTLHGLEDLSKPLKILESGQKSLGRIVEKALQKGENPSELHDLVRASMLSEDIGDIGRFQELFLVHAKAHPEHMHDALKVEPWQMLQSGYSDTKIVGKLQAGEAYIDFESQQKTPAERRAEMRSHQIYDFQRSALKKASHHLEDDAIFGRAVKGYNALMATLNPRADEQAGRLIQRYSAIRQRDHANTTSFPSDFEVIDTNIGAELYQFRPLDEITLPRATHDRKKLLHTMVDALEDLHFLYHLAGAQQSRGQAAALSASLFEKLSTDTSTRPESIQHIANFVPTEDTLFLPVTRHNPHRGHFSSNDQERIEALLKAQKQLPMVVSRAEPKVSTHVR
jgi:hypothetical protein